MTVQYIYMCNLWWQYSTYICVICDDSTVHIYMCNLWWQYSTYICVICDDSTVHICTYMYSTYMCVILQQSASCSNPRSACVACYAQNITNVVNRTPLPVWMTSRSSSTFPSARLGIVDLNVETLSRSLVTAETWILFKGLCSTLFVITKSFFMRISWVSEAGYSRLQQNFITFCIP